ncbi:MAG: carbon-nitrogen hydrolase family protein [Pseudomonadota bacterium]
MPDTKAVTWRAALVQMTSGLDPAECAHALTQQIKAAGENGASFVSTPEMSNILPANRKQAFALAQREEDDVVLKAVREAARQAQCWVHIGSLCLKGEDKWLLNRSFMIDPSGAIVTRYDKIHMFDVDLGGGESYRESALYKAGSHAMVLETPLAAFGLSICYDLRFPGLYETLALAGAQILLVPAAFTQPTGEAHWETLLKARAIETGCFVMAAGQTGTHESGRKTHGHTMLIDPWGRQIAALERAPGALYCDMDMTLIGAAREKIPSLQHRKPFELMRVTL